MKKTTKFLVLIAVVIVLTFVEVIVIKGLSGGVETKRVVIAKEDIQEYQSFDEKYEVIDADIRLVPEDAVTDENELKNMVASMDIYRNKIIVKSDIVNNKLLYESKKGYRLIAIEPKADQVNAWQINKNDMVDVVCVKSNKEKMVVKDVEIVGLINEEYERVGAEDVPKFVILEASLDKAIQIASYKSMGEITLLTHRMGGGD